MTDFIPLPGRCVNAERNVHLWKGDLYTTGHQPKAAAVALFSTMYPGLDFDAAFHEYVRPGDGGWWYCNPADDGAIAITVSVIDDKDGGNDR